MKVCYVYVYLDPRKPGKYTYGDLSFPYEPFYIGKGSGRRKNIHVWATKRGDDLKNPFKYRKIRRIVDAGLEPIIQLVETELSEGSSLQKEEEYITLIGRGDKGPLVNLTSGGENNPMTDPIVAEKVRQHHIGRKRNELARKRMSDRAKVKVFSKEHRENIGLAQKNNCHAGKPVRCLNVDTGEVLVFPSILRASKSLNISATNIHSFIRVGNKKNNVKGWRISYEIIS